MPVDTYGAELLSEETGEAESEAEGENPADSCPVSEETTGYTVFRFRVE